MRDREQFSNYIVAFLDILGFSAMVEYDSACLEGQLFLPRLEHVITETRKSIPDSYDLSQFSDAIVMAAPYSIHNLIEMTETVRNFQRQFCTSEILLRGGISYGRHYSSERIMYSKGLVSAYRLESKYARYPRVIIDENLLHLVEGTGSTEAITRLSECLIIDDDGRVFVDYLGGMHPSEYYDCVAAVAERARSSKDPSALEKLQWMAKYHRFLQNGGQLPSSFGLQGMNRWSPSQN